MCSENIIHHFRAGTGRWSLGVALEFPQLGELQEDRVRVHERNRETDRSVEEASAKDVVPQECRRRMREEREWPRALTALVHLARRESRVVIDAIELIAEIAKRVVLKLVDELTGAAVDGDRLVNVESIPARRPAVIESGLEIRIEVRRPYPASEVVGDARNPIPRAGWLGREERADLRGQRRRNPFVGVEREDPVVGGQAVGEGLLIGHSWSTRGSRCVHLSIGAIATVSSVLPQSTTMISSAQAALSMASAMWSASLRVMMVTETFGTPASYGRDRRDS